MCYKKSDQLYIFGSLFNLFLFVQVAMEQALLSRLILSYQRIIIIIIIIIITLFSVVFHITITI